MRVTTAARTAFDLGRRGSPRLALARVEGLMRFAKVDVDAVLAIAPRHPKARGQCQLQQLLAIADGGAESPQETYLRRHILEAGFPPLETQIAVPKPDGISNYFLDMGWEDIQVAVEYDGEEHRTQAQWAKDIERLEYLQRQGWTIIRVIATHRLPDILRRIRQAIAAKVR